MDVNRILPAVVLTASLPFVSLKGEQTAFEKATGANVRRLNAEFGIPGQILNEKDFQIKNYDGIAIATDLEPDDVLALAILFNEANRIYETTGKYPIQMIVVGEGNATIKKMRMEKLIEDFFNVPDGVLVRVVEGKSTEDNQFIYDGLELFDQDQLIVPFPEIDQSIAAAKAIEEWADGLENPFLIQLKPAQELLYVNSEIGKKISILFYGSFNLRKTAVEGLSLEKVMDQFALKFKKLGILEQYGVLGDAGKVCIENEWSKKIQECVEQGDTPFISMFRELMDNWNAYIVQNQLNDCCAIVKDPWLLSELEDLKIKWDPKRFEALYQRILEITQDKKVIRKFELIHAIASSRIQFTMSDILVAMACTNATDLFQANQVKIQIDENQFLIPAFDPSSNVIYYGPSQHEKIGDWIDGFLNGFE